MASNEVKAPTIDFCKPELKPGTPQWEETKKQVFKALQEYGCFEAIYDKVPNEIREGLFECLKQALPLKDKLREYIAKPYHIYEGQYPHYKFLENVFHSVDVLLPKSIETFANTFWPGDGNTHFCNVARCYAKQLVELDEMVKRMVLESLGLNHYTDEFLEYSNVYNMRFAQYFKEAEGVEKSSMGLPSHTDASFISTLKQSHVGLQLQLKNGEWIEPNVSPNSYFVLSADSFVAWTNGRLHSPIHRVMMKGDTNRFSIQISSTPKPGHIVEAPKELVDEDHPLLSKPFDIDGFYKYFKSGAKYGLNLTDYLRAL